MPRKRSSYRSYSIALLSLCLAACDRSPEAAKPLPILANGAKKPNIVFILVDTLRADRLGCYGHTGHLTPAMDALAREGVQFEHCFAVAPWTLPSISSLFCAYYPSVHKVTDYQVVEEMRTGKRTVVPVLSKDFQTLAEVLQSNGYQTAAVVANPFIQSEYGFGRGFDFFADGVKENAEAKGTFVNQNAADWLRDKRDASKPFFLYLHYMDVHGPYDAPPKYVDPLMEAVEKNTSKTELEPWRRQMLAPNNYLRLKPPVGSDKRRYQRLMAYREYWMAGYEAGVCETDDYISDLFAKLRELNLWEDTYFILTSDHGEAFAEHGYWEHGGGLHQTQLRVPLILRWPGVIPRNGVVTANARLIDIMPTLLDQLRIPVKGVGQGTSLVRSIAGDPTAPAILPFAEAIKIKPEIAQAEAIVSGNYKLIRKTIGAPVIPGEVPGLAVSLFDLSTDPGEQKDLAQSKKGTVEELLRLLDRQTDINADAKPGIIVEHIEVKPQTHQKLIGAGYVGGNGEDERPKNATTQPSGSQPTATAPAAKGGGELRGKP